MTVVLCGVGADAGNVGPDVDVDADGRFEYVPIPEKCETTETDTYGSLRRRNGEGVLADGLDWISPRGDGPGDTPEAIQNHPVHHDPNFRHLTYGEHRAPYVSRLRDLDPGDVVGFYTGLRGPEGRKHRYLVGYFAVSDAPTVVPAESSPGEARRLLADHPHNAHAKRFEARGRLLYDGKDVVVVRGRAPGGLLDRAVALTDRLEDRMYRLAPDVADALGADADTSLGGFKPALSFDVSLTEFVAFVESRPRGPPTE